MNLQWELPAGEFVTNSG